MVGTLRFAHPTNCRPCTLSSWRKPGPIPRNLSVIRGGRRSSPNQGLW